MVLVSVIIPTYNRGKLILRAINSVLNQTYKNIEIIVVDDCSSDDTKTIVQSINDKRVRYLCLDKNSGACVARNKGIECAQGDYIAFQDSDDEWLPSKLEKQIEIMKSVKADVSFCNFTKINKTTSERIIQPKNISEDFLKYETLLKKSIVSTQCIVAKKECFKDIKFDETLPRLQDWDIILSLSKKYSIYHIDEALVNMYVQEDSISNHPDRGIRALNILWKKHKESVDNNKEIKYAWHIYLGNYLLANHESPAEQYKLALGINFNSRLFVKYILARLNIIIPLYKLNGTIK